VHLNLASYSLCLLVVVLSISLRPWSAVCLVCFLECQVKEPIHSCTITGPCGFQQPCTWNPLNCNSYHQLYIHLNSICTKTIRSTWYNLPVYSPHLSLPTTRPPKLILPSCSGTLHPSACIALPTRIVVTSIWPNPLYCPSMKNSNQFTPEPLLIESVGLFYRNNCSEW